MIRELSHVLLLSRNRSLWRCYFDTSKDPFELENRAKR